MRKQNAYILYKPFFDQVSQATYRDETDSQTDMEREHAVRKIYSLRPLPLMMGGIEVDDLQPHCTYYNYACGKENQQTNDSVRELERETDRRTDRDRD